ncbi:succinate dehydrogenase iron-sulfur subunit [Legionella longbeachae]|uniref:Succinate dehydrogenase iron-sulfur subunit n=1 Tax=Legionella longbeachae serogroup 1 (strain NSW150) TaxID=661367 RepID=D3HQ34_LEGLN|nr:succinate dehydrogenase iron-sulfur subunit [Legionella longbeachae]VEE01518.1 succinate dehydrogenase, iron sulfur protein [Legionella oakridgensis]HBD7396280.1 succinate dehydrogenase iron-sulfur subunit [Legionella pneumophila]ARB92128.1 succinate dehydrogenase iron-sulfur subunit [Legionella longbeachae]ARM34693.1 succinate dehydrogenase iron-sulfur subunit [Legionella longbeachae]EEZ95898.1 succinate dehydrogenase iron-sulfur subunit [Legionella longbeachae D-4968]
MRFSIYRYNPETDTKPYIKDYDLDIPPDSNMMVLDALQLIREKDETLAFRASCREGVCGSDGMNINGLNRLACITSISSLTPPIVIRPLISFTVIRDLVVDFTLFFKQYERVKPYLQNDNEPPLKERLQTPEERAKLDGLYECILCACCTSNCPSSWWNPEKFIGPAGLLSANRFLQDSRDTATEQRLADLQDPFSVYRCRTIMNCTVVCPKHLNPAEAIADIRRLMTKKGT